MKNEEKLEHIRHSLAHLLAAAVIELYPDALRAIGPAIENGFYYDFEFSSPLRDTDLPKIEKRMKKILTTWKGFEKHEVEKSVALKEYKDNPYKGELIEEFAKEGKKLTIYQSGKFRDLCGGGHVQDIKEINIEVFRLTHVAGAYWRGNENNTMLTRIYGLAFSTKEELTKYVEMQEEAKKRDHRKLGKELDLFTFSPLVGSGLPLFTPKGTLLRNLVVEEIYKIQSKYGYEHVWIPHIAKEELYKVSGHLDKFGDALFKVQGKTKTKFVIKPMNCPHHTQIYASRPRSYRDLPIRYVETTTNYRDEQPGELLGLSRVRSITQDDGHVFCTEDQIEEEVKKIIDVIKSFYTKLKMFSKDTCWVSLSLRDPETPDKYLGNKKIWDISEKILEKVAKSEKLNYKKIIGEAAFYGPKLDFMFKDALGRVWQLATIQLDLNMPSRFGLEYTSNTGEKRTPVMIHRAIAGSLERFLSVLIEHFAGAFPLWLSPVQVKVLSITEAHKKYATEVFEHLKENGIRVELDDENETLGKKIRKARLEKVPYFLVIGDEEVKNKKVTLEKREGKTEKMSLDDLLSKLEKESLN